jgi:hypothetical protein
MLGGGDEDALAHEAGGVADFGDVAPEGGDEEVFEVLTDEDDSRAGGCGEDADGDGDAGMEANAGAFDGALDGGFVSQMDDSGKRIELLGKNRTEVATEEPNYN